MLRGERTGRPASFTSSNVDFLSFGRASNLVNTVDGLHHIIEEGSGGIIDILTLPESKGIDKAVRKDLMVSAMLREKYGG